MPIGQQSIIMKLNISFQAPTKTMTGEQVLKSQNDYQEILKMFLVGCFDGTFSLQVKPDSKQYQAPPSCAGYALQKPFREELE